MTLRGLTVGSDKTLRLDGARFRNIGLNYGNAVCQLYTPASTGTFTYTPSADQDAMLDVCDALKVKVLRIKAFPYYPAWWTTYVNNGKTIAAAVAADREAHYLKLDAFIAKCRARGIGVVLNMFFRHATPSDLAGQQVRAGWLTAGSATRNFVQAVTQEVVTRYLTEGAVYGYEWSNEVNHRSDASDATRGSWPVVNVGQGTLASYSAAGDIFNGAELSTVIAWWHGVVTAIDNQRIVLTGNGPNSYSQPGGTAGISTPMASWYREQARDNPTNCGSIHWYGNVGYGSYGFRGLNTILTGVRHWQQAAGRGFVLGEFGNQPWMTGYITAASGVATFYTDDLFPADLGDRIAVCGTGTALDHQWLPVTSINAARNTITVAYGGGSFTWGGRMTGAWTAQPWGMLGISGNGTTATLSVLSDCPAIVGNTLTIAGTGTAWDGQTLTIATINAAKNTITATAATTVSWTGVKGLRPIDGAKLARLCDDIINSGVDVALWWMLDSDTGRPVGESINDAGNTELRAALLAANTSLGW